MQFGNKNPSASQSVLGQLVLCYVRLAEALLLALSSDTDEPDEKVSGSHSATSHCLAIATQHTAELTCTWQQKAADGHCGPTWTTTKKKLLQMLCDQGKSYSTGLPSNSCYLLCSQGLLQGKVCRKRFLIWKEQFTFTSVLPHWACSNQRFSAPFKAAAAVSKIRTHQPLPSEAIRFSLPHTYRQIEPIFCRSHTNYIGYTKLLWSICCHFFFL